VWRVNRVAASARVEALSDFDGGAARGRAAVQQGGQPGQRHCRLLQGLGLWGRRGVQRDSYLLSLRVGRV